MKYPDQYEFDVYLQVWLNLRELQEQIESVVTIEELNKYLTYVEEE